MTRPATPRPSTFSIVARDPEQDAVGVAVQSKFISVGSVVPFVSADAGAIATQSFANVAYGPDGHDLLRRGKSAKEVVMELTGADPEFESRQVGVVKSPVAMRDQGIADGTDEGETIAAFTGTECFDYAGDIQGEHYTVQGNILENQETLDSDGGDVRGDRGRAPRTTHRGAPRGQRRGWRQTRRAERRAVHRQTRRRVRGTETTAGWTCASTTTKTQSTNWNACSKSTT